MHQSSVPFIDCQGCANLGRPTRSLYWRLGSMAECQPVTSESHQNSSLVAGLEISSRQDNCPSCAGPVFISPGRRLGPRPRRRHRKSFDHGWSRAALPTFICGNYAWLQDPCLSMQQRHSCRASLHVISTTAMLCSVASQTVCSGAYSQCRTRQRDLSPALVDVTTSHQCWGNSTGFQSDNESSSSWPSWSTRRCTMQPQHIL